MKTFEEYHKADVELKLFLEACREPHYSEKQPSLALLVSIVAFVVAAELTLVFYFLGESLGTGSALYAGIVAIVFIFCTAAGVAFCHANTSRNLSAWRRFFAAFGMILFFGIFVYSVGILSSWRADSVSMGLEAAAEGYRAMAEVPVFVTALVNLFGFALLVFEMRRFFWARYWGYRSVRDRYDDARAAAYERLDAQRDPEPANA